MSLLLRSYSHDFRRHYQICFSHYSSTSEHWKTFSFVLYSIQVAVAQIRLGLVCLLMCSFCYSYRAVLE
jgi:hypothetical protein